MHLATTVEFRGVVREAVRLRAADGRELWATVQRPKEAPAGAAVLVPGWSGPRSGPAEILATMADRLAAGSRFLCVRFDIRGRGDSQGVFGETDLDMMIEDALAACRHARDASGAKDVAVIGLCSGGNVALGAATLDAIVERVAPLSTYPFQASRGQDMDAIRRRNTLAGYAAKAFQPETWKKLIRGEIDFSRVRKNLETKDRRDAGGRNLKDSRRDIEKALAGYRGRCLFVYGGADEEGMQAQEYFQSFASAHGLAAAFRTVPGANHNFYRKEWREELIGAVQAFLK